MLTVPVPGFRSLQLTHLVLDYNGTLACDGRMLPGVALRLERLAAQLAIHIITADTCGTVAEEIKKLPCHLEIIKAAGQDEVKDAFVRQLGASRVVAVGNGRNDRLMLESAALGLAVMQAEGTARETMMAADVLLPDILAALDLLLHPHRLIATLRN